MTIPTLDEYLRAQGTATRGAGFEAMVAAWLAEGRPDDVAIRAAQRFRNLFAVALVEGLRADEAQSLTPELLFEILAQTLGSTLLTIARTNLPGARRLRHRLSQDFDVGASLADDFFGRRQLL